MIISHPSERIDPHHFVLKPKFSKKSHDQLRMDNRGVRNGSHDSGNAALQGCLKIISFYHGLNCRHIRFVNSYVRHVRPFR